MRSKVAVVTRQLTTHRLPWLAALVAVAVIAVPQQAFAQEDDQSLNPYADYFISSDGTNQLVHYDEVTGQFLGVLFNVSIPAASNIGFGGDLYLSAQGTSEVLRFDGFSGAYKGVFIHSGEGGLVSPVAPSFGPDNLVYVGDSVKNQILRYDWKGKFIDVFADQPSSGLAQPAMQLFDDTTTYVASKGSNSVLRYDLRTKRFLGAFVPAGSGGLVAPIGMEFGPDGNLYVASSGTNAVLRYDGHTGAFIDQFVPPGTAGINSPHAINFGGPHSNLYVISTGNNQMVEFDRVTGAFVRVVAQGVADGPSGERGTTFTPRPTFQVHAYPLIDLASHGKHHFAPVLVGHRVQDFSDPSPRVKLLSIVSSDPNVDIHSAVRGATLGEADFEFELDFANTTGAEQHYTITYIASNRHHLTKIATAEVKVPASH